MTITILKTESFFVTDPNRPKPGDSNYEPLRSDRTRPKSGTKRDYEIIAFNVAVCMLKQFRYRDWMGLPDVVSAEGERIDGEGNIYLPRFKKKVLEMK